MVLPLHDERYVERRIRMINFLISISFSIISN